MALAICKATAIGPKRGRQTAVHRKGASDSLWAPFRTRIERPGCSAPLCVGPGEGAGANHYGRAAHVLLLALAKDRSAACRPLTTSGALIG